MSDGIKACYEEQEQEYYGQQINKLNNKLSALGTHGLLRELEEIQRKVKKLTDSELSLKRYQHIILDDIVEIVNNLLD